MRFEFATATRIIFGRGTIQEVGPLAAQMGNFAFVVTGREVRRAEPILSQLKKQAIKYVTFSVPGEPTTTIAKAGVDQARQAKPDLVIGIGGGSVLDTGKVIAAMMTNAGQLEEYLEVVGDSKPITQSPLPYIAIPTTAGTGAEVTRNAVLGVPDHKVKVSMRSPLMLPRVAVVDPALTDSMPPALTASTGLDALTQLIEAYLCNKANPLTDAICREGIKRAGRSLRQAYQDGGNRRARDDMALASLFSGLALANAGLGAVHGLAGPLGGMINAPHGVICARLLPIVYQTNVQALCRVGFNPPNQKRMVGQAPPYLEALTRYDQIAQLLTGRTTAKALNGLAWVQDVCTDLAVPSLAEFGLKEQDFPAIVTKSKNSSSMKGNPITLTDDELTEILKKAAK